MKKREWKKATEEINKGEKLVDKRMEWLLVADFYGYEATNVSGTGS